VQRHAPHQLVRQSHHLPDLVVDHRFSRRDLDLK
jgi:hypothetical protein